MSKSDGFFVRPKFPMVPQDRSVQSQQAPQQKPMTQEDLNEMILKDMEEMGLVAPDREKCKACPDLVPCAMMQILNMMGLLPK
jgi:hypothetical protein